MFEARTPAALSWILAGYTGKNLLVNGGMNIWQRGTIFDQAVEDFVYTADQWWCSSNATSNPGRKVNRLKMSVDDAKLTGQSQYLKLDPANQTSTIDNRLFQYIENNHPGETVTMSAWVNYDVDGPLTFEYRTNSNLGGDNRVVSTRMDVKASDGWQRLSWSFTVPVLPGGADPTLSTSLAVIHFENVTTNAFRITGVQLEAGYVSTEFEKLSLQQDLAQCQRYYVNANGSREWQAVGPLVSGDSIGVLTKLPQTMYSIPTIVLSSISSGSVDTPSVLIDSKNAFFVNAVGNATSQGAFMRGAYTATATIT